MGWFVLGCVSGVCAVFAVEYLFAAHHLGRVLNP